jgi:ubiquinone/menaquinone biosynthesis C-methylase UbiE
METLSEVARLQEVYRQYAARDLGGSKWSPANKGNQAIRHECQVKLRELLFRTGFLPLQDRRILDLGCGAGERLAEFQKYGARPENLLGVDLIPERISAARANYPRIKFEVSNAEALPVPEDAFDLVAVFTVFTSILDRRMAANICREIDRVLVRGGGVIWYDFRMDNPANRNVHGISRRRIHELFPGFEMDLQTISLLPPIARRLGRLTSALYPILCAAPFLRSHYLGVLKKP